MLSTRTIAMLAAGGIIAVIVGCLLLFMPRADDPAMQAEDAVADVADTVPADDADEEVDNGPEPLVLPALPQAAYKEASRQFEIAYKRPADRYDALSLLGEASFRAGNWPLAIAAFQQIPTSNKLYGIPTRVRQGEALVKLHRAREAEAVFRNVLSLPEFGRAYTVTAIFQLIYLYGVQLRFEERHALLKQLHELGEAELSDTLLYCFPSQHRWNGSRAVTWFESMLKVDPRNFKLRVALGRYRMGQGELDKSRYVLQKLCVRKPDNLAAQAALLACLHEQSDFDEMQRVMADLPTATATTPATQPWLLLRVKGGFYQHNKQYPQAVACFKQLLQAVPTDSESHLRLGQIYAATGKVKLRDQAFAKANGLARIQNRIGAIGRTSDNAQALLEVVEICRDIGFNDQALLMIQAACKLHPDHQPLQALRQELAP